MQGWSRCASTATNSSSVQEQTARRSWLGLGVEIRGGGGVVLWVRWEFRARRSSGIWIVAHAPKLKAVASALAAAPHLS